ncbi:DUF4127 family protein [Streptomyces sp. VRA16 Mangrove soil]|uniref:DUF4127 family protein n=1 Tax=Streptomyces sp. VRA16 Mangrove soil TaxID=2817434 RepID=UPI001A9CBAD6|nr:DUF4127 family protein [Streptomyces sp. VRA16 Mangrove soil]MBO1332305.1 DUF4127 family protein [Streptomyces sp. VRA16 Mangrove soil]
MSTQREPATAARRESVAAVDAGPLPQRALPAAETSASGSGSGVPRGDATVIALLPLDERPACAVLPAQVAAVAGVTVRTPPASLMPRLRTPGDADALGAWLEQGTKGVDAAVVSLETLGHGGLIASRTSDTTSTDLARITARLDVLRRVAVQGVPLHAVTLVTRTPDSADAMEEPVYWDPHGPALHRLSAALHRTQSGAEPDPGALAAARTALPTAVRGDFLRRRLRNHSANLAALALCAEGVLDTLVVGADDTAPWGLATAELTELRRWADRLECGESVAVRPGADEATTTLVARTLTGLYGARHGTAPVTVRVEAVVADGLARVAPYENMPVDDTASGQIAACGARRTERPDADVVLLVHTPDGAGDWAIAPPAHRAPDAAPTAAALAERAARLLDTGHAVAVADCAQPNGADPLLVRALLERGIAHRLIAYAGWNTAGNTLGTVIAHAVAARLAQGVGTFDAAAHRELLAHRFTEDWGYMTQVRRRARAALATVPGRHDHVPEGHPVLTEIAEGLAEHLAALPEFGLTVAPDSVRLPWHRTFEADFRLEPAPDTHRPSAARRSTENA